MANRNGRKSSSTAGAVGAVGSAGAGSTATADIVSSAGQAMAAARASLQSQLDGLLASRAETVLAMNATLAQIDADKAILEAALGIETSAAVAPTKRKRGRPTNASKGSVAGKVKTASATAGTRRRNDTNLPEAIAALLAHTGPLNVQDIATQVQNAPVNYKTTSEGKTWNSIVQQVFTNHGVRFNQNGSIRSGKDGAVLDKNGRPAMFVRIARGVYDVYHKGDTAEKIAKRGEKFLAAQTPAAAAA